jgi:hypothetical protein
MSKITDMIGKVNRYGIVQANNYRVVFSGIAGAEDTVIGSPGGIVEGSGKNNFNTRMSLSCESVTLPGRSLSTNPFKTIGIGIEVPYERLYSGDIEMTFLFGRDMQERKIFEKWMDKIINPNNNRFSYYNSYIADIDIIMFDESDEPIYKARIEEAYPKEIGAVALSNESSDLARQSITFSFKKYHPIDVSEEMGGMSSTEPSGLSGRISNDTWNQIGSDFIGWLKRGTSTIEKYGHDGKVISRETLT